MSNVQKLLKTLKQEIAEQKDRAKRIQALDEKRSLLEEDIEAGSIAKAATYETRHSALLERYVDGDLDEDEYAAANQELEKERISIPSKTELLQAVEARKSKENSNYTDASGQISRLQRELQATVFDETIAKLQKKPGVVKAMKELVVLCEVCMRHEAATIEEFIGITDEERTSMAEQFENSELLLARL